MNYFNRAALAAGCPPAAVRGSVEVGAGRRLSGLGLPRVRPRG